MSSNRSVGLSWWPLLLGLACLFLFQRYLAEYGAQAKFGGLPYARDLAFVSTGEYRLWFSYCLLGVPGGLLIAYGAAAPARSWLANGSQWLSSVSLRGQAVALVGYFGLLLVLYYLGNAALLLGHVITDDENAVAFGAKILVDGHLTVPSPEPAKVFQEIFTFKRDGQIASMDWPGVVSFWALSIVTHTGPLLYSLAASLTGVAVVATARTVYGLRGGVLAAGVWLVSPMALSLSFTTHGHVISRLFVATALLSLAHVTKKEASPCRLTIWGATLGLSTGIGFTCRPFEVGSLLAPAGMFLAVRAATNWKSHGRAFSSALLCLAAPLGAFAWYNFALTGSPLIPPRLSGMANANHLRNAGVWGRVGRHVAHNALMLALWFWGPLGLALAGAGVRVRPTFCRICAAGVVCGLLVALGHDNVGIHMVGPIHYSEAAVPLALLATGGILKVVDVATGWSIPRHIPRILVLGYMGSIVLFLVEYAPSLRAQASFTNRPYAIVQAAQLHNAIVVADPPSSQERYNQGLSGSWALGLPHPDPHLRDDVLFASHRADLTSLRERFPTRAFYRLRYTREGPLLEGIRPPPTIGGRLKF